MSLFGVAFFKKLAVWKREKNSYFRIADKGNMFLKTHDFG
jgi:hypothetical protein